ncbi:MAG: prephenate dehydrogenase/arogenate dehydrogenase family protein [Gemmatimonadetes bacterium]|nr:prephenate dehydrogenase/arogenate dehydrogenase family protein [Gemmatimonadota bacterium]MDA1104566.1 prephenate dehydrogenase/arogenate dehydrogenase family protein [Gemmatimonadota bacterium]
MGLGLIGGSLARAISSLQLAEKVTGWSPQSTERDAALTAGALTFAAADWREAVSDADLVVVAAPLEATRQLFVALAGAMPEQATITDVVSLKAPIAKAAKEFGLASRWVGSHPLAGGTTSGFWASRADLFTGARVWTVAHEDARDRIPSVHRLWAAVGARPEVIEADVHDRLMAVVSGLPQLVANALAEVIAASGAMPDQLGPGGRDMTRLAGSSPDMWIDLLTHAPAELPTGLRDVAESLKRLADHIEDGDTESIRRIMRETQRWSGSR